MDAGRGRSAHETAFTLPVSRLWFEPQDRPEGVADVGYNVRGREPPRHRPATLRRLSARPPAGELASRADPERRRPKLGPAV